MEVLILLKAAKSLRLTGPVSSRSAIIMVSKGDKGTQGNRALSFWQLLLIPQ